MLDGTYLGGDLDNDEGSAKVPLRVHQGEAVTCRRATGRQGSDQFDWECACRASLESDVWILRMLAGEEGKGEEEDGCWWILNSRENSCV